jgi:serine/threonine-protein kinase
MSAPLAVGDVIRQKYVVEGLLGQGGMAFVFSAVHLHLQQRVAIKVLRPDTAQGPEVIERFLREARAASRLDGAHVARVIDVDTLEDGTPFIVMEQLEGCDLAERLRERPLAPFEAASYVRQACLAIADAHALGVVHRDLKPANLFLARKRSGETIVKVLDFGISKLLEDTRITKEMVGMGSAEYMSPEQMRSAGDVDGRTDIWSLGVTLYELTTGRTPFHAEGVGNVVAAVMTRDPAPPRQLRAELLPGLEAVILRCLNKDPARRYATAAELGAALAPFTSPPLAGAPAPAVGAPPPGSPRVALLVGGALGVLGVLVVLVAFAVGRGRPGAPAAGRYQLEADTVRDAQTGLTWQRKPAGRTMDWTAARAHCAGAGAGFRLPETDELQGLLAVTTLEPPLDPVSFPTTPVDVFWSSAPASDGSAWVVHFSDGRRTTSVISARNRVRCVR